jgi:hypothetical protein
MDRVNELRNALKHKGTLPSKAAIELAWADVRAFLEDATMLVFGLDFASINMAGVIPQDSTRAAVNAATAAAASGDLKEAMGLLAEAYDELFNRAGRQPRSFAAFGENISYPVAEHEIVRLLPSDGRQLARFRGCSGSRSREHDAVERCRERQSARESFRR